jgi:hypothetical protein
MPRNALTVSLFQRVHTSRQLRQVTEHDLSAQFFLMGTRRDSTDRSAVRDVPPNFCAGANRHARSDREMALESRLAADHHVAADCRRPGKAGLRRHRCVRSDSAVVSDLAKIVDLCAFPDSGASRLSAVDAGVCSNLNVAFQNDVPNLGNALQPAVYLRETEPLTSNDGTGMEHRSLSDCALVHDHRIRMKHGVGADLRSPSDIRAGIDDGTISNSGLGFHDGMRPNVDVLADRRACVDDCTPEQQRALLAPLDKLRQQRRERGPFARDDHQLFSRLESGRDLDLVHICRCVRR